MTAEHEIPTEVASVPTPKKSRTKAKKNKSALATEPAREPVSGPAALLIYLDELIGQLRTLVTRAIEATDAEAIHQARVATRRLKAAVDLLEPVLGKSHRKPFGKTLRTLRRSLGPLRDLDVLSGHLQEYRTLAGAQGAADWLIARMNDDREGAVREARDTAKPAKVLARLGAWWGLHEEVRENVEAVPHLLARSLHGQLDAFAEGADRLIAQRETDRLSESRADRSDRVDPHAIRIAGKSLRYTLEMADVVGHELPPGIFKMFKKMQESLGLWHDYVVLCEQSLSIATRNLLAHHDGELQARILVLAGAALEKSRQELNDFGDLWIADGEELTVTIRERFPLSKEAVAPVLDALLIGQPDSVAGSTGTASVSTSSLETLTE